MDLAIGLALLAASAILFWSSLPRNGEMQDFLKKPGMEVTVTLLFVTALTMGGALLLRGILGT